MMALGDCLKIIKLQLKLRLKFNNVEVYNRYMEVLENETSK